MSEYPKYDFSSMYTVLIKYYRVILIWLLVLLYRTRYFISRWRSFIFMNLFMSTNHSINYCMLFARKMLCYTH